MFKLFNYFRSPIEKSAMIFVVFIVFVALMGPYLAPHDPYEANFKNTFFLE